MKNLFLTMATTALLFSILLSCGNKETEQMKPQEPESSEIPEASKEELSALLPPEGAIAGWKREGELRYFNADNLWEYIDGAAEQYITYGFLTVVAADYLNEDTDNPASVEIYRMKDPVNAFGIYSQERSPDYNIIHLGMEGYVEGTQTCFWDGDYYVKLTVYEESEALQTGMKQLAEFIADKIPDAKPEDEPVEFTYFTTENFVEHSESYIPFDVLGQVYLNNGFQCIYRTGDSEYKIIIVNAGTSSAAMEEFISYRSFIDGNGGATQDINGAWETGFSGNDNFYGKVFAAVKGSHIEVVLGAPEDRLATRALTTFATKHP